MLCAAVIFRKSLTKWARKERKNSQRYFFDSVSRLEKRLNRLLRADGQAGRKKTLLAV